MEPIEIIALGNRLIIRSKDEAAVTLIQQLINLYTKSPGKGDYVVIPRGILYRFRFAAGEAQINAATPAATSRSTLPTRGKVPQKMSGHHGRLDVRSRASATTAAPSRSSRTRPSAASRTRSFPGYKRCVPASRCVSLQQPLRVR